LETPTAAIDGDGDIRTTGAPDQKGCTRLMPFQKERAAKSNYVNWLGYRELRQETEMKGNSRGIGIRHALHLRN
jgi:hypothetical protein